MRHFYSTIMAAAYISRASVGHAFVVTINSPAKHQ